MRFGVCVCVGLYAPSLTRNAVLSLSSCTHTHIHLRTGCITRWLERNPSCPNDRGPLCRHRLRPAQRLFRTLLDALRLRCPGQACGAAMLTLGGYAAHVRACVGEPEEEEVMDEGEEEEDDDEEESESGSEDSGSDEEEEEDMEGEGEEKEEEQQHHHHQQQWQQQHWQQWQQQQQLQQQWQQQQ